MKTIACALMLAALPAVAVAAERPGLGIPPAGVTGAPRKPETGELKQVPGSGKTYTQSQIDSINEPPDWFPDEHPPMPSIVAHGRGSAVRACISCHLSTGHGHPENSRLPGASAGYIARQLVEFRSGVRKGAANMLTFTKAMSDEEMKTAAEYFASLPVKRWTAWSRPRPCRRPTSSARGACRLRKAAPSRSDASHRGSGGCRAGRAARSQIRLRRLCAARQSRQGPEPGRDRRQRQDRCLHDLHGPTLKGIAEVPGIAGQSPVTIARQLYLMSTGERAGAWAPLMKGVV